MELEPLRVQSMDHNWSLLTHMVYFDDVLISDDEETDEGYDNDE